MTILLLMQLQLSGRQSSHQQMLLIPMPAAFAWRLGKANCATALRWCYRADTHSALSGLSTGTLSALRRGHRHARAPGHRLARNSHASNAVHRSRGALCRCSLQELRQVSNPSSYSPHVSAVTRACRSRSYTRCSCITTSTSLRWRAASRRCFRRAISLS